MLTDDRKTELRALCDAATPGPWEWSHLLNPNGLLSGDCEVIAILPEHTCSLEMLEADAAFIAASRTAVPEILDEVERLQSRNARLVALVRRMEWQKPQCSCGGFNPRAGWRGMEREGFCRGHKPGCPIAAEIAALCGEE